MKPSERDPEEQKRKKENREARKKLEKTKEYNSMNNIKPATNSTSKKGEFTHNKSRQDKKWKQKREKLYTQRVWRGWRESDGESHPVKISHIDDL